MLFVCLPARLAISLTVACWAEWLSARSTVFLCRCWRRRFIRDPWGVFNLRQLLPNHLVQFLVPWQYRLNEIITIDSAIMDVRPTWIDDVAGTVIVGAPVHAVFQFNMVDAFFPCQFFSLLLLGHFSSSCMIILLALASYSFQSTLPSCMPSE